MRQWLISLVLCVCFCVSVGAVEYELPAPPASVADLVPEEGESFSQGLWNVIKGCVAHFSPSLAQASGVCMRILAVALLCSFIGRFSGKDTHWAVRLASVAAVGTVLLEPSAALMELGITTVRDLSEYGKLLLPVMTGALAAQGGGGTAAALYGMTAFFDSVISSGICSLMIPMLYLFLGLSVGFAATGEMLLGKLRQLLKWMMQWVLKLSLYLFTGFLTVTGVVSGNADAAAMKAAKITISGTVPVIGSILSDASEAVLVGAGVMRSTVGVYGLITLAALFLSPFVKLGAQYRLIKMTGGICSALLKCGSAELVQDFAAAMGIVLAATATQTVLLMISTVCLMKGVL